MTLNYWNVVDKLLEVVPELIPAYRKELAIWLPDKPGPHVVFGDILTPYLIEQLELNSDTETLTRIFGLLEELAASPETSLQEVVALSVLERVSDKRLWRDRAWQYAGPATRGILREIRTPD